jgi:GNAT superfamily N-acetyltransferase
MTDGELLDLYDHHERWQATWEGAVREETPESVRLLSTEDDHSFVLASRLDEGNADAVIAREIAALAERGPSFEWKHFDHDAPRDLLERLQRAGFEVGEDEALLVADLDVALPTDDRVRVRRVRSGEGLDDLLGVFRAVWPEHHEGIAPRLRRTLERPDGPVAFVAYRDDEPVSGAWTDLTPGSPFATLRGGATLPHARGTGCYRALVAARLRDARERGRRYAVAEAGPMSLPILARVGFRKIATTRPCMWRPPRAP